VDVEIVLPMLRWFVRYLSRRTGPAQSPVEYHAAWKTKAMEDFGRWLAEIPADRPPAASTVDTVDMFALLSEFCALRQEIRFQNREQSKAVDSVDQVVAEMREAAEMFKAKSRKIETLEENIRMACEKKTAAPFFEVRDSLARGKAATQKVMESKTFLRPLPKGMDGILEGYGMAIGKLDKALSSLDIAPVTTVGKPFDPKTMEAVGKKKVEGAQSGAVVEEVSGGFVKNGDILKTARVIVAE
jgi:molecular chaperone GrpE (heat shock protein)